MPHPELQLGMIRGLEAEVQRMIDDVEATQRQDEKVETYHWSFEALDYLARTGALPGYPENYFASGQVLTRGEFAEAIARFLDFVDWENVEYGDQLSVLAYALREEYSDDLLQLLRVTICD